MESGSAPDPDDVAALEAVWGRRASATAPASPRPDLASLIDPPAPPGGGAPARDRRPADRRRRAWAGAAVAVAVIGVVVSALVVLGDDDAPSADGRSEPTTTAPATEIVPATSAPVVVEPAWSQPVTCRAAPDQGGRPVCPVAADDERAYAVVDQGGVATVEARGMADGAPMWATAFPEGAAGVQRLPATVLVTGVGPDWLSVGLDPVTGAERWRAPGTFIGSVGRDHLVLDDLVGVALEERSTMTVVEATTGRFVLELEGTPAGLYVHPCDGAGLAIVRRDGRLTAHTVADGVERWSVPVAEPLDAFRRVRCDAGSVAYAAGDDLHLLDAATGAEVGTTPLVPPPSDQRSVVLGVIGGTVVVGSSDGVRGYRAAPGLDELWHLECAQCGPEVPVGPAGDGVMVVLAGEAVALSAAGERVATLDLAGRTEKEVLDGMLIARGRGRMVVAPTGDLTRPIHMEAIGDVRTTAVGSAAVVVATTDEVRAYPREG